MSDLRVILISRRFWPMVGGAEMVMANLACEFRSQGVEATMLTAQWEPHWPQEVWHREVPVIRLPSPRQRGWGTFRYMRSISRWLRENQDRFDGVLVSMFKHDACAAIGALASATQPVIVRAEGAGDTGDCAWHEQARFGLRIRRACQQADAFIAPSAQIHNELAAAGFDPNRTHLVPNGVAVPEPRDRAKRSAARIALAEVNHDLVVDDQAPVVVYTGRLHPNKGLFELVRAWPRVLAEWPAARLWLIGEGPARDDLYELILDLELRGAVLLPGAFDEVRDVLYAADLFVLPSYEEGMSISLLEAMSIGLPVVATDIPANQQLVEHETHGLLVPPRNVPQLADAMIRQLQQTILAEHYAQAARARVQSDYSLAQSAAKHLQIVRDAIGTRSARPG